MWRLIGRGLLYGLGADLVLCFAISSQYIITDFPPTALGKENYIAAVFVYDFPLLALMTIPIAILLTWVSHKNKNHWQR